MNTQHRRAMHRHRMTLLRRLRLRQVKEEKDGECCAHALARAVLNDPRLGYVVRRRVVEHLRQNRATYESFLESDPTFFDGSPNPESQGSYEEYLSNMAKSTTFFDHMAICAATEVFDLTLTILGGAPFGDTVIGEGRRAVTILYNGVNHYDSVEPLPLRRSERLRLKRQREHAHDTHDKMDARRRRYC